MYRLIKEQFGYCPCCIVIPEEDTPRLSFTCAVCRDNHLIDCPYESPYESEEDRNLDNPPKCKSCTNYQSSSQTTSEQTTQEVSNNPLDGTMSSNGASTSNPEQKSEELLKCQECGQEIWYMTQEGLEILKREFPEDFNDNTKILCEGCEEEPTEEQKAKFLKEMQEL